MKIVKGCLGIFMVLCVVVVIIRALTHEKKPPPTPYSGSLVNNEKLDSRALPLLQKKGNIVHLKAGDTTITWQKLNVRNKRFSKERLVRQEYTERKRIGNSAFSTLKMYDKDMNIMFDSEQFQDHMYIGWIKEYDVDGKLIKTYNEDQYFDFTIDDLIRTFKEKYDRDLSQQLTADGEFASRHRVSGSKSTYYRVKARVRGQMYFFEIRGYDGGTRKRRRYE